MGYGYHTADRANYALLEKYAVENRKNPTDAERLLWDFLKGGQQGAHFRRQHIVMDYIPDFICLSEKLIIEIDGGYHSLPEQQISDEERTEWLEKQGYKVIRFTNEEILYNIENVLERIKDEQNKRQG